jgi:hypothetical protein
MLAHWNISKGSVTPRTSTDFVNGNNDHRIVWHVDRALGPAYDSVGNGVSHLAAAWLTTPAAWLSRWENSDSLAVREKSPAVFEKLGPILYPATPFCLGGAPRRYPSGGKARSNEATVAP